MGGPAWVADLRGEWPAEVQSFLATPPPGHFDNYGAPPELLGAIDLALFVERVQPSLPARR